jgi:DNA-binding transcriptional LysR family regulator
VPRAVAEIAASYPGSRLYLESQLVREIVTQLVRQEADIAISTLPIEHALLSSEVVGRWSLTCVFHAGHELSARRSVRMPDLANERVIAFTVDMPQGRAISDFWRDNQIQPQAFIGKVRGVFRELR